MDADVEVDVDANGLVCFALLRFALPARDVFARDAPKTHQYLVHSRLRGGGKPSASASSSLTWTLQQRACSSSVAFQSQCLRDRSRYWFWHCRSRAERLPLALASIPIKRLRCSAAAGCTLRMHFHRVL